MVIDLRESMLLRAERHRPDVLPAPDWFDEADVAGPPKPQRKRGRPKGRWREKRPTAKQLKWLETLHTRHRGQPSEQVRALWRYLTRGKVAILIDELVALEQVSKKSDTSDAISVDT
jgi:hypothetical protein